MPGHAKKGCCCLAGWDCAHPAAKTPWPPALFPSSTVGALPNPPASPPQLCGHAMTSGPWGILAACGVFHFDSAAGDWVQQRQTKDGQLATNVCRQEGINSTTHSRNCVSAGTTFLVCVASSVVSRAVVVVMHQDKGKAIPKQ